MTIPVIFIHKLLPKERCRYLFVHLFIINVTHIFKLKVVRGLTRGKLLRYEHAYNSLNNAYIREK